MQVLIENDLDFSNEEEFLGVFSLVAVRLSTNLKWICLK